MKINRISAQLDEYLKYKRSLGFQLRAEEVTLNNFANYTLTHEYDGPLTQEIVLDWLRLKKNISENTKRRNVETIVPFSKYVIAFDDESELVTSKIIGSVRRRTIPYIYTEAETALLMERCKDLYSKDGLRVLSTSTAIGLLWSTGLRPSELINLKIKDVDLLGNLLYIWNTKFKKDRIVPLSSSTSSMLSEYTTKVNLKVGKRNPNTSFFVTDKGNPLTSRALMYAFKITRTCLKAKPLGHPNVRLMDFRHTFACRTIISWLKTGVDVNEKIFYLSTYLGHSKPKDTYWYLSATPEMLNLTSSLFEAKFGGGYDE